VYEVNTGDDQRNKIYKKVGKDGSTEYTGMGNPTRIAAEQAAANDPETQRAKLQHGLMLAALGGSSEAGSMFREMSAQQTKANEAKATGDAAVGLAMEQRPGMSKAEIEAVRRGVVDPFKKTGGDGYKVEYGDVMSAFGRPVLDEKTGEPMFDPLTGRQQINRDTKKEQAFFKWMRENGIKDTNQGLALYLGQQSKSISEDARAIAIRDNKDLSIEQKRAELLKLGYQ
jgi:hypothetical protein